MLKLRRFIRDDLEQFFQCVNFQELRRCFDDVYCKTIEEANFRLNDFIKCSENPFDIILAIEVDSEIVGLIEGIIVKDEIILYYFIKRSKWHMGYASKALTLFLKYITTLKDYSLIKTAICEIDPNNKASRKTAEANGFIPSGIRNGLIEYKLKLKSNLN